MFHHKFKPAWWLPGAHLQTLWPNFFRNKRQLTIVSERLELSDGDFLDLAWSGTGSGPIVVILHGLNGGVNSHYVNGMLYALQQRGWRSVLMHFRGCSGEQNRLARSYHSGETGDLNTLIHELNKREPNTHLFVLGYSLGGNVLLKALGEGSLLPNVRAAVAVSVPFELNKTADHLSHGFSQVYQRHLVRGLTKAHQKKFKTIAAPFDFGAVNKYTKFWEFDDAITAPLHGFVDAADYYAQSSSRQYMQAISIPTLVLHALNDPFTPLEALPTSADVSSHVTLEYSDCGGHVGFVSGVLPWKPVYWLEQRILQYFAAVCEHQIR